MEQPDRSSDMEDIESLVEVCSDTFKEWEKTRIIKSRRSNPIKVFFNSFCKVVKDAEFDDLQPYFLELYEKNRRSILNTSADDTWISKEITVWYGHDIPSVKKDNIKMMISAIHTKAEELRDASGPPSDGMGSDIYYLSDEILYFTLKVFRSSIKGTKYEADIKILDTIIDSIAVEIGINEEVPRKPVSSGNGFGGMINMVAEIADNAGIRSPSGGKVSDLLSGMDFNNIGNAVGQFMNNPGTKEGIAKLVTGLGEMIPKDGGPPPAPDKLISTALETFAPLMSTIAETSGAPPPPGVSDTGLPGGDSGGPPPGVSDANVNR